MKLLGYHRILTLLIVLSVNTFFYSCKGDQEIEVSVLIRDALIIDGSGQAPYPGDVWIVDDIIEGIGRAPENLKTQTMIEANGMVVAPGFIDLHAHGDPYNDFQNFLYQGVTTICLGMDGFSPENLSDWLMEATDSSFALNIAMFTGHSSIRMESGIGYNESPSKDQIEVMTGMLDSTLAVGSFGLSTGLEYRPGGLAKKEELEMLAKSFGLDNRGLIMSHLRNEDDEEIEESIKELLNLGMFTPVHISHIKVVYGKGANRAESILDLLDSARGQGVEVTADIYPYTASYTGIGILFPDWSKQPNDYEKVKLERWKELKQYLLEKVEKRNGPEATLIGTSKWRGLNLQEIEDRESRPWVDILIDEIGPDGASGAYFIMDEELQNRLSIDPYITIASDGSPTMNHPRGYGTFAKVVSKYVKEDSLLTIEEAVRKMTSLPAHILGLRDRGSIKEGNIADLVIFDPDHFTDNATFGEPHELATGLRYSFIAGEIVLKEGKILDEKKGTLLMNKFDVEIK